MKKYNSKCLDCGRTVPNGQLCFCHKPLPIQFEAILREGMKKAIAIEEIRDALLEAVRKYKDPVKLLSKEGQKTVKEELSKGEFRPYRGGHGGGWD